MNTNILLILIFITITILQQKKFKTPNYFDENVNTNICHYNITAKNF